MAFPSFLAGQGVGVGCGLVVGCFIPGVLRKLKAAIVALAAKIKAKFQGKK